MFFECVEKMVKEANIVLDMSPVGHEEKLRRIFGQSKQIVANEH